MKSRFARPTLYLMIVCAVALLVFLLEKSMKPKEGDILHRFFFEGLDTTAVARIEIEHLLNGVQLKKEGGQWFVADLKTKLQKNLDPGAGTRDPGAVVEKGYRADANRVDLCLTTLQELEVTSLAGRNPNRHGTFEVNQTGMQVKLFDAAGKKMAHLTIGKTGPAFTESYVRKEGENEVYLASRYLRSSFPPEVNDWRDKTIWKIPPETIEQMEVARSKNPLLLKKKDGKWEGEMAQNLAANLSHIQAAGFEENPKNTGLEKPSLTIKLITAAGPLTLMVGKEKEYGEFYAKQGGEEQIYLVRESLFKQIPNN